MRNRLEAGLVPQSAQVPTLNEFELFSSDCQRCPLSVLINFKIHDR